VGARTGDNGCPEDAEEGNVVGVRPFKAYAPDARAKFKQGLSRSGKTRPSLGPRTRARRSSLHTGGATRSVVARSRRYRGRANLRKREEPAAGSSRTDGCTARRSIAAPARERALSGQNRKVVEAIVRARNESRGSCPHVEVRSCRSR
jgi:hypothetical protein